MIEPWKLRPIQALLSSLFFEHKHLMVILPRQEGKTELGVRLGHNCIANPKQTRQGLFLTKSKEAAKKMTREKLTRIYAQDSFDVNTEIVINKQRRENCLFIDSVDKRPDKLRGGTYKFIHWAEVAFSEFDHGITVHDVYHKVLKPTLRDGKGLSYLESTPNGKNGWYEMFQNAKELGYFPVHFSLSKLVELGLRTREEYDELKRQTPELVFRQEYESEFVSFQGLAYEELQPKHIWKDMPAPEDYMRCYISIDWGYFPSATCVLFGYVIDGRICIFDELYGKKWLLSDVANEIKKKLQLWNIAKIGGVGDHEPRSIAELTKLGIPVSPCDKTNVTGNRLEIKTLLKQNKLYIHPRCEWLLKDLQSAEWDNKKDGELRESICSWGHFDGEASLRYFVRQFKDVVQTTKEKLPANYNQLINQQMRVPHGF